MTGSAKNLQGNRLWLFDHTVGSNEWVLDDPVTVFESKFSYDNNPIGDESEPIGEHVELVMAVGGAQCAETISAKKQNSNGDLIFKDHLPKGCQKGDSAVVIISKP